MSTDGTAAHYAAPGWFTQHVFNRFVAWLTARGVSVWGSRVLEVRGRRSGKWRATPVNLHEVDGRTYLVAPRGVTQWVRNLRASGTGRLRLGRRQWTFRATELDPQETAEILRSYLKRWKWEVGQFFEGVGPDADDQELIAIAPRHPVFVVELEEIDQR